MPNKDVCGAIRCKIINWKRKEICKPAALKIPSKKKLQSVFAGPKIQKMFFCMNHRAKPHWLPDWVPQMFCWENVAFCVDLIVKNASNPASTFKSALWVGKYCTSVWF